MIQLTSDDRFDILAALKLTIYQMAERGEIDEVAVWAECRDVLEIWSASPAAVAAAAKRCNIVETM